MTGFYTFKWFVWNPVAAYPYTPDIREEMFLHILFRVPARPRHGRDGDSRHLRHVTDSRAVYQPSPTET